MRVWGFQRSDGSSYWMDSVPDGIKSTFTTNIDIPCTQKLLISWIGISILQRWAETIGKNDYQMCWLATIVLLSRQRMCYQAGNECVIKQATNVLSSRQWMCYQAGNECVIKQAMNVLSSRQRMCYLSGNECVIKQKTEELSSWQWMC